MNAPFWKVTQCCTLYLLRNPSTAQAPPYTIISSNERHEPKKKLSKNGWNPPGLNNKNNKFVVPSREPPRSESAANDDFIGGMVIKYVIFNCEFILS